MTDNRLEVKCYICDGLGRIDGSICHFCYGLGKFKIAFEEGKHES